MKRIDLTKTGGFPLDQETLAFMQSSYTEAFAAIASCLGNKVIVSGMVVTSGTVASGWLVYNGELIKFNSSALNTYVAIAETSTNATFEDGLGKSVYFTKTALCSPTGAFLFSDLVRLENYKDLQIKLNTHIVNAWRTGDVKEVDCSGAYVIANFDSTGLGINERSGWAVCNGQNGTRNRQGRTSVGLQFPAITTDPVNNIWDVLYNTIGSLVGKNKHQLTIDELAEHDHVIETGGDSGSDNNAAGYIKGRENPDGLVELRHHTQPTGGDEPHENRQPSIVTLFIQKI